MFTWITALVKLPSLYQVKKKLFKRKVFNIQLLVRMYVATKKSNISTTALYYNQ